MPNDTTVLAPWLLFCSAALLFWDALPTVSAAGKMFPKLVRVWCFGVAFSVHNNQTAAALGTLWAAAFELRRKQPFLCRGEVPRGATAVSPCPLCSGGHGNSSFHNAICAFLEQSQRESLLAKPLLSFDLLVLITCTSSCHSAGGFFLLPWMELQRNPSPPFQRHSGFYLQESTELLLSNIFLFPLFPGDRYYS